ncbi:MAG: hypothetical protein ACRES7_05950 [Gammaproteobacteria bacterium]
MQAIFRILAGIIVIVATLVLPVAQAQVETNDSLSVAELRQLVNALPKLPGRILAVKLFRGGEHIVSVAVLTYGDVSGWQIFVLAPQSRERFRMVWKSGKLDYKFTVSYPDAMKIFNFGAEDGIYFSGCAPHSCGGGPSAVFSVLLYVPSKNTAYRADYTLGKTTYSSALQISNNKEYKGALEQLVSEFSQTGPY